MNKLKKFLTPKNLILLVLLLCIPAFAVLTQKGYFPTQDYIYVARVYEVDRGLRDGQFPVRWASDFRYGEPTFNFYAPLPYYIGSVIYSTGLTLLDSNKVLIALSILGAAAAMFFLGRELYGNLGGVVAAMLYTYAPYHSVDIYVRGAISEAWALVFFPLIFLFSLKLSKKFSVRSFIFLALSLAGLFYTHNIMTLIFMPFYLAWVAFLLIRNWSWGLLKSLIGSLILGFGLAASFLLPAFFEKNLVQSSYVTGGYFDWRGHFVEISQFFSTFWGYGASLWGPQDGMSFSVGLPQWIGFALAWILGLINFKKNRTILWILAFLSAEFAFSLFMQHNRSTPIWLHFQLLQFVQFPWRFLGISIFFVSLIAGSIGIHKVRWFGILAVALVIFNIGFNLQFFHPESFDPKAVDDGYVGSYTLSREERLPKDYLPIYVKQIESGIKNPYIVTGQMNDLNFEKHSSWATAKLDVKSQSAQVEFPLTYFPGWTATVNNHPVNLDPPGPRGLIRLTLPQGVDDISFNFGNTPIRFWGDFLTIISIGLVILLATFKKWHKYLRL